MTDDLEQAKAEELLTSDAASGEVLSAASADSSIAAGIPSLDDVSREDVKDAINWVWEHTLGDDDDDEPPAPMAANVVFESEEEVTTETSNVEHDDPPPPPRAK